MKGFILTAIILAGAHICEMRGVTLQPCVLQSDVRAYETFAKRHILSKSFDKNSLWEWMSYLQLNNLCGRTPKQSFIDAKAMNVKHICTSSGRLVQAAPASQGDFCISQSTMRIYEVVSDPQCNVTSVNAVNQRVIVRCAAVQKGCLPIHFEAFRNQQPSKTPCVEPRHV